MRGDFLRRRTSNGSMYNVHCTYNILVFRYFLVNHTQHTLLQYRNTPRATWVCHVNTHHKICWLFGLTAITRSANMLMMIKREMKNRMQYTRQTRHTTHTHIRVFVLVCLTLFPSLHRSLLSVNNENRIDEQIPQSIMYTQLMWILVTNGKLLYKQIYFAHVWLISREWRMHDARRYPCCHTKQPH